MHLLELPQELLAHILNYLSPSDIINFGRSCQRARSFVDPENKLLWQSAFLHTFDDPQEAWCHFTPTARKLNQHAEAEFNWHTELKRRFTALQAIDINWTGDFLVNGPSPDDTIDTLLDMISTARSAPTQREVELGRLAVTDDRSSRNIALLPTPYKFSIRFDRLVRGSYQQKSEENGSALWHSPGRPTTRSMAGAPGPRTEAACKLHVLCGVTELESKDHRALGAARCIVYDWDLTNEVNEYGPFKDDGSGDVDWPRLEAVCSVVTHQFGRAVQGRMTLPQGFDYSIPYRTLIDPTEPNDWARVTGTWCGTYVFLNWEDLLEFNTMTQRPSLEDGPESCGGLMKLELKLNEDLKDDPKLNTNLPICTDLPPLYFSGISRSSDFYMATIVRGMACLTPNGKEVRWRFIIK